MAKGRSSMSMGKRFAVAAPLALWAGVAIAAEAPGLGKPVSEADLTLWDISVGPDGKGLPPGSGTAGEEDHRHVGRLAQATQRLHAIHDIGRAIGAGFAREGAQTVLAASSAANLAAAAAEIAKKGG